jgi:hypothetical protein
LHKIDLYTLFQNMLMNIILVLISIIKRNNTKYIKKSSLNQETETNNFPKLILKTFTHHSFILFLKMNNQYIINNFKIFKN